MFESIYVHIPFCRWKCSYCAFVSRVLRDDSVQEYIDCLIKEIRRRATGDRIKTIYFGGGTPTVLHVNQLGRILNVIRENFDVDDAAEITIEANPGTVDENYLRALRDVGFNRLSIGVQTFNDELLKILERIHTAQRAYNSILLAKKFFDNVSVDLMYGLSEQKLSDVQRAIEIVVNLGVQHISIYGLEVEPETRLETFLRAGKLKLPEENLCEEMYDFITETLPGAGYRRYEISNFAQVGFESRHNLGYWTDKKYIGFGVSAHSYDGKIRTANTDSLYEYLKKMSHDENPSTVEEIVSHVAAMEEYCFLGLRTAEGLSVENFSGKFGENIFDVYGAVIDKYVKAGLLENSGGRIFLTARGMKLSNVVMADFLL